MNNLNTCTLANREARANTAAPIKDILVTEFRVPEAGVASSGDAKDSVFWRTARDAAQYPINQRIVVSQLCLKTTEQLRSNGVT